MNKVAGQLAASIALLSIGFTAGWWANTEFTPVQRSVKTIEHTSPGTFLTAISKQSHSPVKPSQTTVDSVDEHVPGSNQSLFNRFLRLLEQRAFDEAMSLYDEVDASNESLALTFREAVRKQLYRYLENDHTDVLMTLIDLYLSRHYDDTEVLLILAEYQRQQGYPDEAARVFQLAFTYAYHTVEREKISEAFRAMVAKTDQHFSQRERWIELLGFYQLLDSINLTEPRHRLRQGQLYQAIGDSVTARKLFISLLHDPKWGQKAKNMLAAMDQQSVPTDDITPAMTIPLQRRGNHYLINVQLNDQTDVVLMIDTGASVTSLSAKSFSQLTNRERFSRLDDRLFNTANGVTKGAMYRAEQLMLGDYRLKGADIAVLDFQPIEGVDGLLGMNVLQHFRFEIDQDQQQLILQPR